MMMMMSQRRRNWSLFTGTQREEFQLQALIYQYLITGMSIPLQLIFTIKTSLNDQLTSSTVNQHHHSMTPSLLQALFGFKTGFQIRPVGWSCYQMGHGRKLDPEPGRCRRTDGKKWRCSKEAGSDSKYCDRHKHRSKKRSRKHVESMEIADSSKGRNTIQASLRIPTNQKKLLMDSSSFSLCSSPDNSFRYGHWKNEEVDNNEHVFLSNAGYGKGKGYSSSLLDDSWQLKEKSYLGFTSKEQCLQFEGLNKPSKHCQNQMFLGTEKVMHHFI